MNNSVSNALKVMLVVLACMPLAANAQQKSQPGNYPNKPLRILVTGAPGGSNDKISRTIGQKLGERWNTAVIVDNRTGAGGAVAMEIAARAAPDGYTVWNLGFSTLVNAAVAGSNKLPLDIRTAFAPITQLISQPYVLVINPSLPVNSVKDLIAYAKHRPGVLNYASLGSGTATHLGMKIFESMSATNMVHVPFKGTSQALIDLIAGQVHVLLGGSLSAMPQVKAGKLRALAVTSLKRSKLLPELPTISEAGVPGFELDSWFGLVAPAGTPPAVILVLQREVKQILDAADVRENLARDGSEAFPSNSPAEFRNLIEKDFSRWEKFAKTTGIKLD